MRHALTLTSQTGEAHTLSVPTSWADVSLGQFIDWQCSDQPALVCLAGITSEQLERLDWGDAGYLLNLLAFATELPDPPAAPDLKDVGEASYGQMVVATQYLAAHSDKPLVYCAPYLYALYRSRDVYGRYDEAKVEQMRLAILAEPVDQVLGSVLFFLGRAWLSLTSTPRTPPTPPSPRMMSWTRAWKSCRSALASCLPRMRWRRPSALPASKSSTTTTPPPATPNCG